MLHFQLVILAKIIVFPPMRKKKNNISNKIGGMQMSILRKPMLF